MKLRLMLPFVAIFLIAGVFLPSVAQAASPSSISITANPENPNPNENVNIKLSSYLSNLDSVSITWFLNGKNILSGVGKKSFSLSAPTSEGEASVKAVISLPDGEIEKSITIKPTTTILLWQANDSYVPPFYKGKAMPSINSEIKIVAMPEIKKGSQFIDPQNMIYEWKQDYTNMQQSSGYGKNYFTYVNDYLEDYSNVAVVASTIDQKYSSSANIDVGATDVKVLFYKNDIDLGTIWEHSLSNGYKITGDAVLEASPYFISPKDIRIPTLSWIWSINDKLINMPSIRKNLIPLKVQEGTTGSSKIMLDIENKYKVFGTAKGKINVTF